MRTSCLAVLLIASLAAAADPPAKPDRPASELGQLLIKRGYTAIPLSRTTCAGMFLVRVALDGHPFTLLLDTGAGEAVTLTKAAAKVLGIASDTYEWDRDSGVTSISGKKYGMGVIKEVTFGGSKYGGKRSYPALAIDGLTLTYAGRNPKGGEDKAVQADGLLGQGYLLDHSAVIDHDTATLYLIPLSKKDGPKLEGRWERTGGEREGKQLAANRGHWIEFGPDETVTVCLNDQNVSGVYSLRLCDTRRVLWCREKNEHEEPNYYFRGLYEVDGDQLRLCLLDEPLIAREKKSASAILPVVFDAKKGSGQVVYVFNRVKAEKK